jgi:citrate lyase beta subunit
MPATRPDLLSIVTGYRYSTLKSIVVCLEDAVSEMDVADGLENLKRLLVDIQSVGGRPDDGPLVFVRPRNADMAAELNDWPLITLIDGFIVPKLNSDSIMSWSLAVNRPELLLMPTLETPDVFVPDAMVALRDALDSEFSDKIIALRIGGNDLMGCLGLRRSKTMSIYNSPMGYVIPMLAGIMGAGGYALTAPVFERMASPELLKRELEMDIAHGLVGKTAIHPSQIPLIHDALKVENEDVESATKILAKDAQAVFKHGGAMCEPATHLKWARNTLDRARFYGTTQSQVSLKAAQAPQLRALQA